MWDGQMNDDDGVDDENGCGGCGNDVLFCCANLQLPPPLRDGSVDPTTSAVEPSRVVLDSTGPNSLQHLTNAQ